MSSSRRGWHIATRKVELQPDIREHTGRIVAARVQRPSRGYQQCELARELRPRAKVEDQLGGLPPRGLRMQLCQQLDTRRRLDFRRQPADPAPFAAHNDVAAHLTVDLNMRDFDRELGWKLQIRARIAELVVDRRARGVELDLWIYRPRDSRALISDEAPFDPRRAVTDSGRAAPIGRILDIHPGNFELELDPRSGAVIDVNTRCLDSPFLTAGIARRGDIDFPEAGPGRIRVIDDQRRTTLG